MNRNRNMEKHSGYVMLLSVLVTGAAALAIGIGMLTWGTLMSKEALIVQQSMIARQYAGGCAEQALQLIRNSQSYIGTGTISLSFGNCTYTVTNQGGEQRKITTQGQSGTIIRRMQIVIADISPQILVLSWQDVADF